MKLFLVLIMVLFSVSCTQTQNMTACEKAKDAYSKAELGLNIAMIGYNSAKAIMDGICPLQTQVVKRDVLMVKSLSKSCEDAKKGFEIAKKILDGAKITLDATQAALSAACPVAK